MLKILVVGRGWTGKKVYNELINRNHIVTVCSHTDAIDEIKETSYHWVVNCAGVTGTPNVDACELDKVGTVAGNAAFPILLREACYDAKAQLAHFSSGCIYQGEITSVEADPNYFGSIYSVSKGVSDLYLKDKALVFRIRMPFTGVDEKKNYLTKVKNYAQNAKLIDAGQNSLTDLDEAVRVACDLIEEDAIGPFNLVNSGSLNMHELAEIMHLDAQWFTPEEFKAATAAGRSTCVIPAYSGMRPVRDAVEEAVYKMRWVS